MNLKKNGKIFTNKSVGTGPSSYEKKNLPGRGLTKVEKHWSKTLAVGGFLILLRETDCNGSRGLLNFKIISDRHFNRLCISKQ